MASTKRRNIDDIDDMMEAAELMKDLGISGKGLKTLDEMKAKMKEHFRGNPVKDTTKEAFSVVSKAKDEDMRKRRHLQQFYSKTKACLDKLDDTALSVLNKNFGNVKDAVMTNQNRLTRQQYYVLVAGESSAGKSSFLNLLLGEQLLPSAVLSSTSTICELKYGLERKLVVHYKGGDPQTGLPTKTIPLYQNDQSSYMDQISSYVHMKSDREKGSPFTRVEIFWPHEFLKNDITVIDSPGVGESQIMDDIVEGYLVKAFAFIYIINIANAGGVQKDRIGKLLEGVRKISDERKERFPSKCALFVCNKWDAVPERERKAVKEHVVKELRKCWPELDSRSQIVYLSTKQAADAQTHGLVSPDFQTFLTRINGTILTAIESRLETHWQWLRYLLSRMIFQTKAFIYNADRDRQEVIEQMQEINAQIQKIENEQDVAVKKLQLDLDEQLKKSVNKLITHLKSEEIQKMFSQWSYDDDDVTEAKSWSVARHEIVKAFDSRIRLFIENWEEDKQVFAETIAWLKQHMVKNLKLVESQLRQLENDVVNDKNPTASRVSPDGDDSPIFSTGEKVIIGVTSPLWIPLTIAVGVLSVPVLGIMAIKSKVTDANMLRKYRKDPLDFLSVASIEYLNAMADQSEMLQFVKPQFDEAQRYLHHMQARIPEIIDANRKLISQLEKETRSKEEIYHFYLPINEECAGIKGKLDVFALKQIRRMDIHDGSLEWGQRLGEGGFGAVYRGEWNKRESKMNVALKVCQEDLDASNVSLYLEEEATLRKLNHPCIVRFFGAALKKVNDGMKFILVMELCQDSLRNYIRNNPEKVPGKSQRPDDLMKTVQWALEISEGLEYIHKLGIVHRDLKLDNILTTKVGTVKIADVGAAKKAKEIVGTMAGTWLYMAPEVWASKRYDSSADMYSFSITMWEMWYGKFAFCECHELTPRDLEKKIKGKEGLRPTHAASCRKPPVTWERVMSGCWAEDPGKRLDATNCHEHLQSLLLQKTAQIAVKQ